MKLTKAQIEDIFGRVCYEREGDGFEISCHTDGGYNIVLDIISKCLSDIIDCIEELDPSEEVALWWSNDAYRANYGGNIKAAYEDIEDWKRDILSRLESIESGEDSEEDESKEPETDLDIAERMFHTLLDELGAEMLLNDLYLAMSTDQALEYFQFIARMNDIEL